MTRDEIVELVRDSLAFNTALNEAIILRHMDRVQTEYETGFGSRPLPWFLFDTSATTVTVASNRFADVPADFVQFDDDWLPTILDASSVEQQLKGRKQYELVADSALTAFPTHFAFDGKKFHLYPMPDAVYTIKCPCYKRTAALSVSASSDWYVEFPSLLVEEVSYSIARASRDKEFLQSSPIQMVRGEYLRRVEEMKHILQQYVYGGHGA